MKDLGIFGTSGFAREVADIALELGHRPIFVAKDADEAAAWSYPAELILEDEVERHAAMPFAIGIGENRVREKVALRYAARLRFATLLHPSASFGLRQRAAIEARRGVVVCAGVRFTNNIQVGDFTVFNLNATIGHDSIIEDFVNLAPGVHVSGNVHIRSRCWVGTGAAINQGSGAAKLEIGRDTVIGSGSVVVRSCDPEAVYVGIPAKRIK
ncbi:MAG TPA: acetyltransferase [Methylibium sp.]|nr:acetyltransferase [Methylibium sp.]